MESAVLSMFTDLPCEVGVFFVLGMRFSETCCRQILISILLQCLAVTIVTKICSLVAAELVEFDNQTVQHLHINTRTCPCCGHS